MNFRYPLISCFPPNSAVNDEVCGGFYDQAGQGQSSGSEGRGAFFVMALGSSASFESRSRIRVCAENPSRQKKKKNIAIQVKSSNFRKGKDWKAVMGGLPILISIDDEVFLRGVLSGEEKLNKDDVVIADVKLIQTIEQNKIVNNYRAVNVIEHKKSSQICTF